MGLFLVLARSRRSDAYVCVGGRVTTATPLSQRPNMSGTLHGQSGAARRACDGFISIAICIEICITIRPLFFAPLLSGCCCWKTRSINQTRTFTHTHTRAEFPFVFPIRFCIFFYFRFPTEPIVWLRLAGCERNEADRETEKERNKKKKLGKTR